MATNDLARARREGMRWNLLNALHKARPVGCLDVLLLDVMRAIYNGVTPTELHSELEYLEDRQLVKIDKKPDGHWHSELNHNGVDVVEYAVDCPVGIARPQMYWNQ
jgi:hypothetical protein